MFIVIVNQGKGDYQGFFGNTGRLVDSVCDTYSSH